MASNKCDLQSTVIDDIPGLHPQGSPSVTLLHEVKHTNAFETMNAVWMTALALVCLNLKRQIQTIDFNMKVYSYWYIQIIYWVQKCANNSHSSHTLVRIYVWCFSRKHFHNYEKNPDYGFFV